MLHDVVAVKDDFLLGIRKRLAHCRDIRFGHIHGYGLDTGKLFLRQTVKVACKAGAVATERHLFHRAPVQVADDGDIVLLPFAGRLFIHPDHRNKPGWLALDAPRHRPVHQVVRFIPTETKNRPGCLDARLPQHVKGKALKQQGEPAMGFSPGQSHLPDPMFRAGDSRRRGMEKGLKLATVQVAPDSLLRVIMQRTFLAAVRTGPLPPSGMLHPDIDSLAGNIKFHTGHRPWVNQTQQMPVQISITHGSPPGMGGEFSMNCSIRNTRRGYSAPRYLEVSTLRNPTLTEWPPENDGRWRVYPLNSRKHQNTAG